MKMKYIYILGPYKELNRRSLLKPNGDDFGTLVGQESLRLASPTQHPSQHHVCLVNRLLKNGQHKLYSSRLIIPNKYQKSQIGVRLYY